MLLELKILTDAYLNLQFYKMNTLACTLIIC